MTRMNMTRINMIRIVAAKFVESHNAVSQAGKAVVKTLDTQLSSPLFFAAALILCSVAVGCSSDQPKPLSSNQNPVTQNTTAQTVASNPPAPSSPTEGKLAPRKATVTKKRPPTVSYIDKSSGISFDYPRRYALETGNGAGDLVSSSALPMNFVQPGGVAVAAVELPETGFADTDFSYAFFNVSVNRAVNADQCEQFAAPAATTQTTRQLDKADSASSTTEEKNASSPERGKLIVGDLELQSTEAVMGEGPRQSDVKYFHTFQNGSCYEFALNVTTSATPTEVGMKHVDRDKVFARLEKILSTVKINSLEPAQTEAKEAGPAQEMQGQETKAQETHGQQPKAPELQPENKGEVESKPDVSTPPAPEVTATAPATPDTPSAQSVSPQ